MARILIVDDEPKVREAMRLILQLELKGGEVEEAADGREALEKVRAHRPDLVLLDIFMPEMDGLELMAELKREAPDLRIVVVSGKRLEPLPILWEESAFKTVWKPFGYHQLLDVVTEALTAPQEPVFHHRW